MTAKNTLSDRLFKLIFAALIILFLILLKLILSGEMAPHVY